MTAPPLPSSMIQQVQQPTFLHRTPLENGEGVLQQQQQKTTTTAGSPSNYLPNLPSSTTGAGQVSPEERKMWNEVQHLNAALLNQQALQAMVKEEEVLHELLEKTLFPKFFPAPIQSQQSFVTDMQFQFSSRAPTRNTTAPVHQEGMLLLLGDLTRNLNDAEVKLQSRIRALEEEKRLLAHYTIDQKDVELDDGVPIAPLSAAAGAGTTSPSPTPTTSNKNSAVVDSMTLPDEEIKERLLKVRKEVDFWDAEKKELLEKVAKLETKCAKLGQLAEAAEEVKRLRLANKSKKAFQGFSTSNNRDLRPAGLNDSLNQTQTISGSGGGVGGGSRSALDVWNGSNNNANTNQNTTTSSYQQQHAHHHHRDPYGAVATSPGSRGGSADRGDLDSDGGYNSDQASSAGMISVGGVGPNGLLNIKGMNHLEQEVKIIDSEIQKYEKLCHTAHALLAVPKIAIPLHKRK